MTRLTQIITLLLAFAGPVHAQQDGFVALTVIIAFDSPPRREVLHYDSGAPEICNSMRANWLEGLELRLWGDALESAFFAKRPRVVSAVCREGRAQPPSDGQRRYDALSERLLGEAVDQVQRERRK